MQIPRWLLVLFTAVMLGLCTVTCWFAITTSLLMAQQQELNIMLTTSKQRETKQNVEYKAVVEQLPVVQEQLAEAQPLADEEKAKEKELRDQRKKLRKDVSALAGVLDAVQASNQQLRDIQAQTNVILMKIEKAVRFEATTN